MFLKGISYKTASRLSRYNWNRSALWFLSSCVSQVEKNISSNKISASDIIWYTNQKQWKILIFYYRITACFCFTNLFSSNDWAGDFLNAMSCSMKVDVHSLAECSDNKWKLQCVPAFTNTNFSMLFLNFNCVKSIKIFNVLINFIIIL